MAKRKKAKKKKWGKIGAPRSAKRRRFLSKIARKPKRRTKRRKRRR